MGKSKRNYPERHKQGLTEQLEDPETHGVRVCILFPPSLLSRDAPYCPYCPQVLPYGCNTMHLNTDTRLSIVQLPGCASFHKQVDDFACRRHLGRSDKRLSSPTTARCGAQSLKYYSWHRAALAAVLTALPPPPMQDLDEKTTERVLREARAQQADLDLEEHPILAGAKGDTSQVSS